MSTTRQQLSMYVPPEVSSSIEDVRKRVDPVQHHLIPAHITLCREEELIDFASIHARLVSIPMKPVTLSFGQPEVFAGHGLLLRCIAGEEAFRSLREYLLGSKNIRDQKPHITLAHPRNPKAPGNSLSGTSPLPEIITLTFPTIYVIEQQSDEPWRILGRYNIR